MNAREAAWRELVSGKLAVLTPQLTAVLQKLVQHSYPPQVASIDFEIFSDGFSEGFPVRAFFMDAENNEFFLYSGGKARYPSPVDPDLLEIDQVYAFEEEEGFEEESDELDLWAIASDELIDWFGSCWLAAGGNQLSISASIQVHDDPDTLVQLPTRRLER
jgi:hypothetical protein